MSLNDAINRVIEFTAQVEGGGRYDAWNPHDPVGISFGLIQFNQKSSLAVLLKTMRDRNSDLFYEVFGPYAENLLDESYVKSANFNASDLKSRLIESAQYPEFKQAQLDVAKSMYFDDAMELASEYSLVSERAMSMLFDTLVQRGRGKTREALDAAWAAAGDTEFELLAAFAGAADNLPFPQYTERRVNLLNNPDLSDASFVTLAKSGVGFISLAGLGFILYLMIRK